MLCLPGHLCDQEAQGRGPGGQTEGEEYLFDGLGIAKPEPNDVDIFLVMDDAFDVSSVAGEARLVFDHLVAQSHFGASVFWTRRASCFPSESEMISGWALKRDGTARGIVEITAELP